MYELRDEGERAVIYIYGTIGEGWTEEESNKAKNIAQELDALGGKPVDVRIDSGGGDVYEGFAIASALLRYEGHVRAYVDGMAASAASYIAIMADEVVMADFAWFMIHDAWCYTAGNAAQLLEDAARLEALDATIAKMIADRTGKDVDEVKAAMDAETWLDAEASLEFGLADRIEETGKRMAACVDAALASRYAHVPEAVEKVESHAVDTVETDNGAPASKKTVLLGNRVWTIERSTDED